MMRMEVEASDRTGIRAKRSDDDQPMGSGTQLKPQAPGVKYTMILQFKPLAAAHDFGCQRPQKVSGRGLCQ